MSRPNRTKHTRKGAGKPTAAQRNAAEARDAKARRLQVILGAIIVGIVAVAAIVMAALGQLPVPVAVGIVLLVAIRLYILKRELKKEAAMPK